MSGRPLIMHITIGHHLQSFLTSLITTHGIQYNKLTGAFPGGMLFPGLPAEFNGGGCCCCCCWGGGHPIGGGPYGPGPGGGIPICPIMWGGGYVVTNKWRSSINICYNLQEQEHGQHFLLIIPSFLLLKLAAFLPSPGPVFPSGSIRRGLSYWPGHSSIYPSSSHGPDWSIPQAWSFS